MPAQLVAVQGLPGDVADAFLICGVRVFQGPYSTPTQTRPSQQEQDEKSNEKKGSTVSPNIAIFLKDKSPSSPVHMPRAAFCPTMPVVWKPANAERTAVHT